MGGFLSFFLITKAIVRVIQRFTSEQSEVIRRKLIENKFEINMKRIVRPNPRIKYSFLPTRAEGAIISQPTEAE